MISSAEEFVRLRTSKSQDEYSRAAHDEATEEVWLDVLTRFPEMKQWVVQNKTVPHSILRVLADDADVSVRCWVAMKRKAGPELLTKLAHDENEGVRERVAYNRSTPQPLLEKLMHDPVDQVAQAARDQLLRRTAT